MYYAEKQKSISLPTVSFNLITVDPLAIDLVRNSPNYLVAFHLITLGMATINPLAFDIVTDYPVYLVAFHLITFGMHH